MQVPQNKQASCVESKLEILKRGEVWFRNYRGVNKCVNINDKIGSRNYLDGQEDRPPLKRHVDQIKKVVVLRFTF